MFKYSLALHGCRLCYSQGSNISCGLIPVVHKNIDLGLNWDAGRYGPISESFNPCFSVIQSVTGWWDLQDGHPSPGHHLCSMVRPHSWLGLFFNRRRLNHKCSPCWFLGHEWLPQGSWHCSCFHTLCFPKPCWSQTEQRRYLSSILEISTCAQKPREMVSAPSLKVSKAAQGLEQPQLVDRMAGNGIRGFLRSLHTQTYLGFHDDSMVSSCIYFALFPLKFNFSNLNDLKE